MKSVRASTPLITGNKRVVINCLESPRENTAERDRIELYSMPGRRVQLGDINERRSAGLSGRWATGNVSGRPRRPTNEDR